MKSAILVIGCSERDTLEVAKKIQVDREYQHNTVWKIVSEKDVLDDYVKTHNYHALCVSEWFNPIKNSVITELLDKTESCINDSSVSGVIVCGQFAIDGEVRREYQSILEEQGYNVDIYPVYSSWVSLLTDCLQQRSSIKTVLKNWNLFTKQFSRQYSPLIPDQNKAIIVSPEIVTKKSPGMFEIVVMLEALQSRGYTIVVIDGTDDIKSTELAFKQVGFPDARIFSVPRLTSRISLSDYKINLFWTAIANYFDVRLVYEYDAASIPKWRDIGIPVISLTNIFDVENLT